MLTMKGELLERVTGIGAVFFRAKDPAALSSWYAHNLGFTDDGPDIPAWQPGLGQTVCPFPEDTDYFGRRDQAWMLNFKVRDLEAMLDQLRAGGAVVDDRIESYDYGRFGWATDPEGNRFELWQPISATPAAEQSA
jgi:catechol 2,3-dioxygenase-like lactoylglutathione lyase family enzyme